MCEACEQPGERPFKQCHCCKLGWADRPGFLADGTLEIVGYQVDFRDLEHGLFLFNHDPCKSTLAVPAGKFLDLYKGRRFAENLRETEECPRSCDDSAQLARCDQRCECAFVREVLHIIRGWPKEAGPGIATQGAGAMAPPAKSPGAAEAPEGIPES